MAKNPFFNMTDGRWAEGKRVCVGLDSVFNKLPVRFRDAGAADGILAFNRSIIQQTHSQALCYKLNLGAYLQSGHQGIKALEETCAYLWANHPNIPYAIDQKTGDIGTTNDWYADFAFGICRAHAITLHNYMGQEAMQSLLDRKDKAFFILCKTSNKGSNEFQGPENLHTSRYIYEFVARQVKDYWNKHGNCGLVVGATYPEEMKKIRAMAPELPFLVPGIGTQGGDVDATINNGITEAGGGLIINNGSAIIFAPNPAFELDSATKQIDRAIRAKK